MTIKVGKEICERALRVWGPDAQMLMALEEMSELSFLIIKKIRGTKDRTPDNWQIAEEIADVEIMMEQMMHLFSSEEEVNHFKELKIERVKEKLGF